YVNEQACRSLGYSREEVLRLKLWDIDPVYPKERWETTWEQWQEDRQGGGEHLETLHRRKDGSVFPVEVSSNHLWFGDQELHVAVCRDITERKQVEEELKKNIIERKRTEEILLENQAVLYATLESMQDGLLVTTDDGRISHYNSRFCQMWAIPENLMQIGDDHVLIHHVLPQLAGPEQFTARITEVYQTSAMSEDILHLRDGRLFERVSYPLVRDGQEKGRVWTFRDVTERKRAEEALRLNNFALESMSDAVHWIAPDHWIVDVNEAACLMLGYTREELIGMSVADLDPMFSLDELYGFWDRVKQEQAIHFETLHKTKDGRTLPVEIMANYIAFEGKELTCCFVRDITQRKQVEDALREREARLRFITDNMLDMVSQIGPDRNIQYVSPSITRHLGYTPQELVGTYVYQYTHPEDFDQLRNTVLPAIEQRLPSVLVEYRYRHADGHYLWLESAVKLLYSDSGEFTGAIFGTRDITDRKRAEQARQELEHIINQSPAVVFLWRAAAGWPVEYVSDNIREFGYTPDDLLSGRVPYATIVHPDDLERVAAEVSEYSQNGVEEFTQEYRLLTRSGESRWIEDRTWVRRDSSGVITHYQGIAIDITARKQAEQALQESEEKNRLLIEYASDAIFITDSAGRFVTVNQQACQSLGYSSHELLGKSVWDIEAAYETPENVFSGLRGLTAGQPPIQFETVHRRKDQSTFPVELRLASLQLKSETLIFATARDISQRKQVEDALRQSEERLRQAVRAGDVGIFDHDHIDDSIYWSPEHRRIYGFDSEERVTLEKYLAHIHPDDHERIAAAVRRAHDPAGDGSFNVEHRNIDRSGVIHWLSVRSNTFFEGEGNARRPVRTIGAVADITERKHIETELRQSEVRYRALIESQVDLISRYRPDTILTFVNDAY
ncbi:MAG: PAS domain S-box protein, partial [Candidatus Methanoperedens sp.]|nr:PAS domain S-box protein [Candidatus Methanoperedens sp.]